MEQIIFVKMMGQTSIKLGQKNNKKKNIETKVSKKKVYSKDFLWILTKKKNKD